MKIILQVNVTANWGSTGKIAEAIGNAAINHGWESYIAYGRWRTPSNSRLLKIGKQWDKYFHFVEQTVRDNEGLCSRKATQKLIKQIDGIKPDVVQLHNIHDHYLNYHILFKYLNQTDIPVVWTFHDCWAFTGHCFHFVTVGCEKWKALCHDCPLKSVFPKSLVDRSQRNYELKRSLFSANKNLHIIPASEWMAGFVRQSFLKDKDIRVIHNGVDINLFHPFPPVKSNRFRVLGVSGVWNKDKGLYDFFILRKMLSKEQYDIVLVGLSKEQISTLPEGITGVERTSSAEALAVYYSSADVFVNPTYADTFPTVNLEALACGTPVVTYRTGGSPEAIDEQTGIVVEQGDVEGLAKAVQSIDKANFTEACRARAERLFDKDKCFAQYIDLYNSLLSK